VSLPKRFFRLDSSVRIDGSVSRSLADAVEQQWKRECPGAELIHRDLGVDPLPAVWPDANAARVTPESARNDAQRRAAAIAAQLVDELLAADAFVLAVPMYNFGVPQQVKHWIDLIICDDRAADVSQPLLPGRPAILVEARGGGYGPGTDREGWNYSTPYLRRILGDVWGLDLTVVEAELTAADFNPAMAHLKDIAQRQLADAHASAAAHAISIAGRLRTAA
jgi:FMN-dependent NADH-azoreductase